ncbi:MAG TPA: lipid-binding SYLF domain-containing protein [Steroidobacteraceae bacterium]|nr:lipid-binding SYLF domain-containing protein [Steroidobacteraceae bacterium]
MTRLKQFLFFSLALLGSVGAANAGKYEDTLSLFKNAGESAAFFKNSYGYAVFPNVGEGGFVLGGAFGRGRVYVGGKLVGDATLKQLSVGFQAGGKDFTQIVFFQDKRALDQFESGSFEFAAGASAIAITAGANASAGTDGVTSGASAGKRDATTDGVYNDGMAVFTIAKGGLMYAATLSGQKFTYKARGAE